MAFKKVRNSYFGLLNIKKKTALQDKIQECTKDSRKLHKLVNNLTTSKLNRNGLHIKVMKNWQNPLLHTSRVR